MSFDEFRFAFSLPINADCERFPVPANAAFCFDPDLFRRFAHEGLRSLERAASAGEAAPSAALSLVEATSAGLDEMIDRACEHIRAALAGTDSARLQPSNCPDAASRLAFRLATGTFSSERPDWEILLLAILYFDEVYGDHAVLRLAAHAVRRQDLSAAEKLADECLRRGVKHPRAFCIAGLCELDRGDINAAQHHLALAARLSRAKPEYRADMRMAQRLLLILNFNWRGAPARRKPKKGGD